MIKMSEFTQTNDSAASGTSEGSEYLDLFNFFDETPHLDHTFSLNSSKTKEPNRCLRKRRNKSGGESENSVKSKGNHKHSSPYQLRRPASRKMHKNRTNFIIGSAMSESLIDKTEKASFASVGYVQKNIIESSGRNDHARPVFNITSSYHSQIVHATTPAKWRMDYSPDSGLDNTTSSPSGFGYVQESSGFCSDIDTSDLGTPNSSDLLILKFAANPVSTRKLRMFFQTNYTEIKEELDTFELADILDSKDLIRIGDREKITELNSREKRCDRLIKSLVQTSSKIREEDEDKFVRQVITSFEEANYGHVFNSFEEYKEPDPVKEIPIDNAWEEKLKYFFSANGNDIDTLEVIDELLENEVVTFKEHTSIMEAVTSKNKRDCLLEAVLLKSRRHFDIFCNVIKEKNPETSKMLFDESVCERMEVSERCNSPKIEIKVLKETKCDNGETEVKLYIEGQDGPDNEFEAMIVDQHSPTPSESLMEMVTEDVHCGSKVSLSCIKIALENYSERALMVLIEKCKSSPQFLERWIKALFDEDKMKKLKQRSTKELRFKIQVNWPEITLTKQDIARNYGYLKDVLEPQDYIDILNEEGVAKDVIKGIELSEAKEERAKKFLIFMVTSCNKDFMRKFTDHIKGTEVMSYLIKEKNKNCTRRCTCKLTKNVIVQTFSFLEEKLEDTDKIVDIFANCSYFSKSVREKFQAVLKKGTSALKNGTLLNQILDLPDDGIQVCLLQDALLKTNQNDILNTILKTGTPQNVTSITKDDVSRNTSFLKQELEPLRFLTMLEYNDPKLKKILLERQSRKQRCEIFLDYLQSCDTSKMESFSSELQRQQLSYVMDYLVSSRHQGYAEKKITKEDIIKNMCFLDDMIDPLELRHLLSGNEHDKSRTALGTVLSTSKKRRCKVFLEVMVDAEESIFNRFSTYLENEKPIAVKYLLNARETEELKDMSNIESLLDAYTCIIEEIEPNRFKTMFLEKQVLSHEDLELICLKSSRKGRAIALMEAVLKGPPSRAQCLIEALDTTGYNTLVNEIKHNQKKCNPCPRLYRYNLGSQNSIVFEGVVNIQFEENFDNRYTGSTSRILVTEASIVDSPVADSGFELSVNTPGSGKASRYTHRSSGYITGSECDTPVTGSTVQNQTPTDLVSNGKKTHIPMSVQYLRKFIVKNFVLLKSEIDPVELIDTLCNEGVISSEIVEKLKNERLRAGKCDLLLKSISRSAYRNDDHEILSKVKFAFDSAGYGHVVKTLEKEMEKVTHETDESHPSKKESQKLDSFRQINSFNDDEIEPLRIIDNLVSEEILSLEEHQDIKIAETRELRLNILKDKMISMTDRDLSMFTRILKQQYSILNEQLKAETKRVVIGSLVEQKPTVHLNTTGKVCRKGYVEDTLVKMYFSCPGEEQHDFYSPLDFDDGLDDVVLENGFEIVPISSSMNNIILKSLSSISQIEFLQKCCESVAFLEEWFQLIFTKEPIERLRQNHITEISVQIHINILDNQQVTCPCMLTQEAIVRHYTCLEKNLDSVDEIIATFSRFKGFDDSTKLFFKRLLDCHGSRTEPFLRKLLDLSYSGIHLCLLENEMRKTNLQLLKQVTDEQKSDAEPRLTAGYIRKNLTFLLNELEPRHFTIILTGLAGSESILEKIMSNEPRQERCRTLINFIMQKKLHRRFIQELERRNKSYLVEFITDHRQFHGLGDIKYSLIKNYRQIIDEIEPKMFREVFVERRDITDIEYEGIRTLPTRRLRAKRLMRVILKGSEQIGKSFLDALEISGYSYLLKVLTTNIEPHKMCPKLFQSLLGKHGEFVITSRFKLAFDDVPKTLTKEPAFLNGHTPPLAKRDMRKHLIEENESLQEEANIKRQRTQDWIKVHWHQERNLGGYDITEEHFQEKWDHDK